MRLLPILSDLLVLLLLGCVPGCTLGLSPEAAGLGDDDSGAPPGDDDGSPDDDNDDSIPDDDDGTPDDDDDGSDDDVTPEGSVRVDGVSPNSGSPEGNDTVVITGEGFTSAADTVVKFGSAVAAIAAVSPVEMTVFTPAGEAGSVSVRVENSNGSDTLEDGFTYFADYTGLSGGLVELIQTDYQDPNLYVPTAADGTFALAAFWVPDDLVLWPDFIYPDGLPAPGSCMPFDATSPPGGVEVSLLDAGSPVSLLGTTTLSLPHGDTPETAAYYVANLPFSGYASGSSYDIEIPGGPDLEAQTLIDGVMTPGPVTVNPPLSNYTQNSFNRGAGLNLTLGPASGATSVVVGIDMYTYADGTYTSSILCHFTDGVSVSIPASAFAPFARSIAVIRVSRWIVQEVTLADGSTLTTAAATLTDGALTAN